MSISPVQTARQSPSPAPFKDCSEILSCPVTGQALRITENWWISADGSRRYPVEDGIPNCSRRLIRRSPIGMSPKS